ncbi:MAG: Uncharacterised protein [Bacteroidetes bacterium MED-G17]|nr:MAG: Uncharacterised protein [Bacteroidetes bacterium MED-G17]
MATGVSFTKDLVLPELCNSLLIIVEFSKSKSLFSKNVLSCISSKSTSSSTIHFFEPDRMAFNSAL